MIRLSARARVALPSAIRKLHEGEVDNATEAVESIAPELGPAERADAATVVELAVEEIEEDDRR